MSKAKRRYYAELTNLISAGPNSRTDAPNVDQVVTRCYSSSNAKRRGEQHADKFSVANPVFFCSCHINSVPRNRVVAAPSSGLIFSKNASPIPGRAK